MTAFLKNYVQGHLIARTAFFAERGLYKSPVRCFPLSQTCFHFRLEVPLSSLPRGGQVYCLQRTLALPSTWSYCCFEKHKEQGLVDCPAAVWGWADFIGWCLEEETEERQWLGKFQTGSTVTWCSRLGARSRNCKPSLFNLENRKFLFSNCTCPHSLIIVTVVPPKPSTLIPFLAVC